MRFPLEAIPSSELEDAKANRELVRERATLVRSLLTGRPWAEIVQPFIDTYTRIATEAVMGAPKDGPLENYLKGQATAFRDLLTQLNVALAEEEQALAADQEEAETEDTFSQPYRRFG